MLVSINNDNKKKIDNDLRYRPVLKQKNDEAVLIIPIITKNDCK